MVQATPKSMRLQIGIFGRTNVGKSSFLNMVAGQDVAITSPIPGTTTDVVEKVMELLPVGPVVFLDTGGLDDSSVLGVERIRRTNKVFDRADIIVLVVEPNAWSQHEDQILEQARRRNIPLIAVVNKIDQRRPEDNFLADFQKQKIRVLCCNSLERNKRDEYVTKLKEHLIAVCPDDYISPPPLLADLVRPGKVAVLIVPIDKEAPKGRIILPQVQTIRDALDNGSQTLVVKETEYKKALANLKTPPDLVVCDSQVVDKMVAETPRKIACTTFSILFARLKGDLEAMSRGVAAIDRLKPGDKVLISESCSHHAIEDDIGRVKIPKWLKKYLGRAVELDVCSGRDYPADLGKYKLVIQCGSCMLTRRETLMRIEKALAQGVAITNYGVCISFLQGVLERVLSPFPSALAAYKAEMKKLSS